MEHDDGTAQLWYTGSDGTTERILAARRSANGRWTRLGTAVDVSLAGESDKYRIGYPSVLPTPAGFLMAYAGSDGVATRLHMATSADGMHWEGHGRFMQRGEPDSVAATHPCLVLANQWWLFYTGYDGADNGRRSRILAAVSPSGASWDRIDSVMEPETGETAVSEPCVVLSHGRFHMFYVSDDSGHTSIQLATSDDGLTWSRRGLAVTPSADVGSVGTPCAVRSHSRLQLWYSAPDSTSPAGPDRLWMVEADRSSL